MDEFRPEIFVGAIKPMDQLINPVGLNFEKKVFLEPPYSKPMFFACIDFMLKCM